MTKKPQTMTGAEFLVPLNKRKKSPKNVRKMPHTEADIEALAAGIGANGLLQNLVGRAGGVKRQASVAGLPENVVRRLADSLQPGRRHLRCELLEVGRGTATTSRQLFQFQLSRHSALQ